MWLGGDQAWLAKSAEAWHSLVIIAEQYPGLLARPDEDKLQLVEELLADVMGGDPEADPVLLELIESRWAEYQAHPERVSSWADVKARLVALGR